MIVLVTHDCESFSVMVDVMLSFNSLYTSIPGKCLLLGSCSHE